MTQGLRKPKLSIRIDERASNVAIVLAVVVSIYSIFHAAGIENRSSRCEFLYKKYQYSVELIQMLPDELDIRSTSPDDNMMRTPTSRKFLFMADAHLKMFSNESRVEISNRLREADQQAFNVVHYQNLLNSTNLESIISFIWPFGSGGIVVDEPEGDSDYARTLVLEEMHKQEKLFHISLSRVRDTISAEVERTASEMRQSCGGEKDRRRNSKSRARSPSSWQHPLAYLNLSSTN